MQAGTPGGRPKPGEWGTGETETQAHGAVFPGDWSFGLPPEVLVSVFRCNLQVKRKTSTAAPFYSC
jgi:hypothetical protein